MKRPSWRLNDEEITAWARQMREAARREFKDKGTLGIRAYVLGTRDPKLGLRLPQPATAILLPSSAGDAEQKQAFSEGVEAMVRRMNALAYVIAFEAWCALPENITQEEWAKLLEFTHHHGVRALKDRRECLAVTYQHVGAGQTTFWYAPIIREGDLARADEFIEFDGATGRFADLMPEVS